MDTFLVHQILNGHISVMNSQDQKRSCVHNPLPHIFIEALILVEKVENGLLCYIVWNFQILKHECFGLNTVYLLLKFELL